MSKSNPSHEQIETRAFQLWQQRGCPWGTPETDWLAAEKEMTQDGIVAAVAREIGSVLGAAATVLRGVAD